MVMKNRRIGAAEFKAKCLGILDEVSRHRRSVVIEKLGKPIARLVPMDDAAEGDLEGSILREGDIVSPVGDDWEADRDAP